MLEGFLLVPEPVGLRDRDAVLLIARDCQATIGVEGEAERVAENPKSDRDGQKSQADCGDKHFHIPSLTKISRNPEVVNPRDEI